MRRRILPFLALLLAMTLISPPAFAHNHTTSGKKLLPNDCEIDYVHVFDPSIKDGGATVDNNGECQLVQVKLLVCWDGNAQLLTDTDLLAAGVDASNSTKHGQYTDHNGKADGTWWGLRKSAHSPLHSDCDVV